MKETTKYKKGEMCLVSEYTWAAMSEEDRKMYTDSAEIIHIDTAEPQDVQRISLIDEEKEALKKELEELKAQLAKQNEAPVEAEPFDPFKLDVEALKDWLASNDIEFSQRVTKLETLQKFIPEKYKKDEGTA